MPRASEISRGKDDDEKKTKKLKRPEAFNKTETTELERSLLGDGGLGGGGGQDGGQVGHTAAVRPLVIIPSDQLSWGRRGEGS